jgi:hypothetical protein
MQKKQQIQQQKSQQIVGFDPVAAKTMARLGKEQQQTAAASMSSVGMELTTGIGGGAGTSGTQGAKQPSSVGEILKMAKDKAGTRAELPIGDAFTDHANFHGITDEEPLQINQVLPIPKAFIEVR